MAGSSFSALLRNAKKLQSRDSFLTITTFYCLLQRAVQLEWLLQPQEVCASMQSFISELHLYLFMSGRDTVSSCPSECDLIFYRALCLNLSGMIQKAMLKLTRDITFSWAPSLLSVNTQNIKLSL